MTPAPNEALRAVVRKDCALLLRARRRRLALLCVGGLALALGVGAALGVPADARSSGAFWGGLGLLWFGSIALCALAFGALRFARGQRLVFALLGLAMSGLGLMFTAAPRGADPSAGAATCAGVGSLVSLVVVAIGVLAGGGVLRRSVATGTLLGLGAGALSLVSLHLSCATCCVVHLLLWHTVVPLAAGAAAGATWGLARRR